MATIKLYDSVFDNENVVHYNLASFNMEEATEDTHYTIIHQDEGTLPTGEEIKQIRLSIPYAGLAFLTEFDESTTSEQNLLPPNRYEAGEIYDLIGVEEVPFGAKPADWDTRWFNKYYLRTASNQGYYAYNINYYNSDVWDSTKQYYSVPNITKTFYTDSTGLFSVSRATTINSGTIAETVNVLYDARYSLSTSWYSPTWSWRYGGLSSNYFLFWPSDFNYTNYITIRTTTSFSGAITDLTNYHSRYLVQMVRFKYNNDTYIGVIVINVGVDNVPLSAEITALSKVFWEEETKVNGGPVSFAQGGDGTFTAPSDNRGDAAGHHIRDRVGRWNNASAVLMGARNRYRIDGSDSLDTLAFQQMNKRLWNPSVFQSFENQMVNPRDAIISCVLMPESLGPPKNNLDRSPIVAADADISNGVGACHFTDLFTWCHLDSKKINLPKYYGAYPDYDDTAIYIHLPYVGVKQIDVEAVMDGEIGVDYATNAETGDVLASVWTKDKFGNYNSRYEFRGNCAQSVLLAYREKTKGTAIAGAAASLAGRVAIGAISGGLSEVVGAAGGYVGATGSLTGFGATFGNGLGEAMATEAVKSGFKAGTSGLSNSISAAMSGAGTLTSNAAGTNAEVPLDSQCFLIIVKSQWSNPETYGESFGYPSDIQGIVGEDFKGFLSVRHAFLNGIPCTDVERDEISSRLQAGIYV